MDNIYGQWDSEKRLTKTLTYLKLLKHLADRLDLHLDIGHSCQLWTYAEPGLQLAHRIGLSLYPDLYPAIIQIFDPPLNT